MEIKDRLKYERIKNNLSQEEVAKAISTTKQAIYKYENGIVTNIPTDKIQKLADLFAVTPAYLMGWEEKSLFNDKFNLQLFADTASPSPTEPKLSEGEQTLIKLFRQIPEEKRTAFLEMGRLYADSLKKD